ALQLVLILIEEREAGDAHGVRVGFQTLHDEIVILAGLDKWAVLTNRRAIFLNELAVRGLVERLFLLLEVVERLAALMHGKFHEGIARARGGRRAIYEDVDIGQRLVDIAPLLVRIGGKLAVNRDFLGKGEENLLLGQIEVRAFLRIRNGKAVIAEKDFDDVLHAVLRAVLEFGLLDRARSAGQVGMSLAHALAE